MLEQAIALIGSAHRFTGYAYGFRQPTLRLSLQISAVDGGRLLTLDGLISRELIAAARHWDFQDPSAVAGVLAHWMDALQRKAGLPIFEAAQIIRSRQPGHGVFTIVQPCLTAKGCYAALVQLVQTVNKVMASKKNPAAGPIPDQQRVRGSVWRPAR